MANILIFLLILICVCAVILFSFASLSFVKQGGGEEAFRSLRQNGKKAVAPVE